MNTSVPASYKLLFLLAINFSFIACHEVFEPEIDDFEPYPVIEGFISTQPGTQTIYLKYSHGYNDLPSGAGIANASVYVNSTQNESIQFKDRGGGVYEAYLDENSVAKIGHTYTLSIYTPEGDIYESKPQTVQECPDITEIGCDYKIGYLLTEDSYGKAVEEELEGIDVIVRTTVIQKGNGYFRYKYTGYEQHHVSHLPVGAPFTIHLYSHRKLSFQYLNAIKTINANDYGSSKNIDDKLIFISERDMAYFNPELNPKNTKILLNRFEGLIMKVQQHSISEDAYKFYNDIENMLEARGTLFDPPVPKITCNIFCTNDSTKKVMGVFSAVDIDTYYAYLYVNNGRTYQAELDSIPPLYLEYPVERKPDTWIDIPF